MRRWRRGFRDERRVFLEQARRVRELGACSGGTLSAVDLGFGPELWHTPDGAFDIEHEWLTLRGADLVTLNGDSAAAVSEAERRGCAILRRHVKF